MTRDIIIAVVAVADVTLLVPAALGLWLAAASWCEDRAMARLRARSGGIVTWEALEPWSDGTVRWTANTGYARNEYNLRELRATVPAGAQDVQVIRDLPEMAS